MHSNYHLVAVEPHFIHIMINCMHQTWRKKGA